jgi:sugar lactone lactonase YvrE
MTNLADLLPAGGGQNNTDFVADGNISSGAPVILTAAGKAAPVSGSPTTIGSPTNILQEVMNIPLVSEITGTNKTYAGLTNYNGGSVKGTGYILTASSNAITVGAAADFSSVESYYPCNCYDSVNNRIVQCWQETGSPRFLKVCVGSVSGTTITWGTPVNVKQWSSGGFLYYARIAFDPDSGNFCIIYRDVTNSDKLTSFCGTVQSGTTTATMAVSPVVVNSSSSDYNELCYDTTQDRFIIIYDQGTTNFYAKAASCGGSGTGAALNTVGSAAEIGSSESISQWPLVRHDSTAGKNVIGFIGAGNTLKAATATIDPSTNAVTIGTVNTILGSGVTADSLGLAYDPTANFSLLGYRSSASPYDSNYVQLTVSGSDIVATSPATLFSGNSQYKSFAYNATEQEIVIVIGDSVGTYYVGFVFAPESSNLTSTNLLGIASGAISDTATGTINTWGSRNEVQTGLTIGSDYYVQAVDGTITAGSTSIAYDISSPTYTQAFSVSSQDTDPTGLAFNTDGTKMFVVGNSANAIHEYALSTGFDISTASFTQSFSVASQSTSPSGIAFKPDGTIMFVAEAYNSTILQYALSSAFDVSSASYTHNFNVASQEADVRGVAFNSDGTVMLITGIGGDDVNEYALSSAYDVSSASFVDLFSIASQDTNPNDLFFNSDGKTMWIVGDDNDSIFQYTLTTGFDISTASYASISFSVASQDTQPMAMAFNSDGTKLYVVGLQNDSVYQYATTATSFSTDYLIGKAITATQINIKDYTG